jgi:hypothetical protein
MITSNRVNTFMALLLPLCLLGSHKYKLIRLKGWDIRILNLCMIEIWCFHSRYLIMGVIDEWLLL